MTTNHRSALYIQQDLFQNFIGIREHKGIQFCSFTLSDYQGRRKKIIHKFYVILTVHRR